MIALTLDARRRAIASARLLDSDKDGERLAALAAINRLLPPEVSFAVVLEDWLDRPQMYRPSSPEPVDFRRAWAFRPGGHSIDPWRRKAKAILNSHLMISDKEMAFVRSMAMRANEPTPAQADWLDDIHGRMNQRRAA